VRGACNLVSAFRVVPLAISRYGCGLCNALSGIDQWLLRFAFFKKDAELFGLQGHIEKKYTQRVFFVQRLDAGLAQLDLVCQLNRLVPSQVPVCLVVSNNPSALAVLASITRLFKKLA
jgi:hypothetical protein